MTTYPVYMTARLADGTKAKVQTGVAVRQEDGSFVIEAGPERIGAEPIASRPAGNGGAGVFPPYGKSKGLPVEGASLNDLSFYAKGCERSLADPSKSRFHDKERALLAAIHAEMGRQGAPATYAEAAAGTPTADDFGAPPF